MPFEYHNQFETPASYKTVWRYMTFRRFSELIRHGYLWFSRSDGFEDKMEGKYSPATYEKAGDIFASKDHSSGRRFLDQTAVLAENIRFATFINCWHLSEHESAAFWTLYKSTERNNSDDFCVAINSNVSKLMNCISEIESKIYIGRVSYVDFSTFRMPVENGLFVPFLHKRESFQYENELRLVMTNGSFSNANLSTENPNGVKNPIDVESLVNTVWVSPFAPNDSYDKVRSLLDANDLDKKQLIQSDFFDPQLR